MRETDFKICFWGCRGSCALGGADMSRYGTNTACVSMECGDTLFIFDAGTGFIRFGEHYKKTNMSKEPHIFLSHYHLDHIEGLPHADILYDSAVHAHFYGKRMMGLSPRELLANLFSPPYFPVRFLDDGGEKVHSFHELLNTQKPDFGDRSVKVEHISVAHPGTSTAFKIKYDSKTAVYLSDYEYGGRIEPELERFLIGADLVIFDAYFGEDDYIRGWGHSTWQDGLTICRKLDIGQIYMFHHRAGRTDYELDKVEQLLRAESERCHISREGMTIYL